MTTWQSRFSDLKVIMYIIIATGTIGYAAWGGAKWVFSRQSISDSIAQHEEIQASITAHDVESETKYETKVHASEQQNDVRRDFETVITPLKEAIDKIERQTRGIYRHVKNGND